jgi:hypothetical protein
MADKTEAKSTPRTYTSKSGRRYAHTSDVLSSGRARAEISRFVKLAEKREAKAAASRNGTDKTES